MENVRQHPLETLAQLIDKREANLEPIFSGPGAQGQGEPLFAIHASGQWYYQGAPLPTRFAKLFASILHCIDGDHFLITPVETIQVAVVDVPLLIVAVAADSSASAITLTSSLGTEHVITDLSQMLVTDFGISVPLARGLWGKLNRACYYRFVNEFNLSD
ncbi:MAG: DUF1285 domain-containing protein [Shewanella sp.]